MFYRSDIVIMVADEIRHCFNILLYVCMICIRYWFFNYWYLYVYILNILIFPSLYKRLRDSYSIMYWLVIFSEYLKFFIHFDSQKHHVKTLQKRKKWWCPDITWSACRSYLVLLFIRNKMNGLIGILKKQIQMKVSINEKVINATEKATTLL